MAINVDNNKVAMAILPIFRLAFRPLFLGGTVFSIVSISWWIHYWLNPSDWTPHGGPIWWHGHEMLFGFGAAIVVGFLLTAVQSWTGVIGLRGKPLALLAITWLMGRVLVAFNLGLPSWLIVVVDVSFLVMAAIAMAYPVIQVKQWRNIMFTPLLLALASLNFASHWSVINNDISMAMRSLNATIILFVLIISILGGRVIPAFTANTTGCPRRPPLMWLEILSILSILIMSMIAFIGWDNVPTAVLLVVSAIAATSNGIRLLGWGIQNSWRFPLLWSLHLAYLFIPLGFVLLTLHALGLMENTGAALHSFTIGSVGGMILGMISRVTLGHTGRPMKPHPLVAIAYVFILSAAVFRVVFPILLPELYSFAIAVSGMLWVLAYAIYVYFYSSMLVATRADGRPG